MSTSVIARVPDEIAKDIQFFAREEQVDRSTEIRRLLALATKKKRIEYALEKYRKREVTLWKAANVAGIPLSEMMKLAAKEKIPLHYDEDDLREDFTAAFGFSHSTGVFTSGSHTSSIRESKCSAPTDVRAIRPKDACHPPMAGGGREHFDKRR